MFVQEERVVLFVEDLSDAVGDRQKHLLVAAQHRRNAVDRAGRLPVQAAAGIVAALLDGALAAELLAPAHSAGDEDQRDCLSNLRSRPRGPDADRLC